MKIRKLTILGTSGNAYDVLDIIEAINAILPTWTVNGFLDDTRPAGAEHLGIPILGPLAMAPQLTDCWFINAIGSDRSFQRRAEIIAQTGIPNARYATLIHPHALVSPRAKLGNGVYVNGNASVAGNVTLEDHVSIGPGCIVGHDTVIGSMSVLAPGAVISGGVQVGRSCYLGAACMVKQNVKLGAGALVGMGAVVTRDVAGGQTVIGNPARPMQHSKPRTEAIL